MKKSSIILPIVEMILPKKTAGIVSKVLSIWTTVTYSFATIFIIMGLYANLFRWTDILHTRKSIIVVFIIGTILWGISFFFQKRYKKIKKGREFIYHCVALAFTFSFISYTKILPAPQFYDNADAEKVFGISFITWSVCIFFGIFLVGIFYIMHKIFDPLIARTSKNGVKNKYLDFALGLAWIILGMGLPVAIIIIIGRSDSLARFSPDMLFDKFVALSYFAAGIPFIFYGSILLRGSKILDEGGIDEE